MGSLCVCLKSKEEYDMQLVENPNQLSQTRQSILEKSLKNMLDLKEDFNNDTPNKLTNDKSNIFNSTPHHKFNFKNSEISEVKKFKDDNKGNDANYYDNLMIKNKSSLLNYKKKKQKLNEEESDFAIFNFKKNN